MATTTTTRSSKKVTNDLPTTDEVEMDEDTITEETIEEFDPLPMEEDQQQQQEEYPTNKNPDEVSLKLEKLKGIGPESAKKLRAYGINDIPALAVAQAPELIERLSPGGKNKNISLDYCMKLIVSANDYLQKTGILEKPLMSSKDLLARNMDRKKFTTGDEHIDNFLGGGGFESRSVTEMYGQFGSGKSQMCYTTAVIAASKGIKVLWLDTENTYYPDRVDEIAGLRGFDKDMVQSNILVIKPASVSMFTMYINKLEDYVTKNKIGLIVVDSVIALHKSEFFGRGQLAPRQQGLSHIMSKLVRTAQYYDAGVIITNHVIANPDPYKRGTEIAAGGNSVAHMSTHRMYLQLKGEKKPYTIATMVDSPRLPRSQVSFDLTPEGVVYKDPAKA